MQDSEGSSAIAGGLSAIKSAWDNLDPGLKQWIIEGMATAVSIALVGVEEKAKKV